MNGQDLKNSILQLAIQGKLVEQREEEGTAKELLEQIKVAKEQLIKEKKIKKSKPLPEITEDEIPFDIPECWEWVRLGDITHNWGQKKPENTFNYIDVGSIDNINGTLGENENLVQAKDAPSRARKIVKEGTVIYSTVRPYLLNICIIDKQFEHEPIASTAFAVLHPFEGVFEKYLYFVLRSPMFISYVNSVMVGVAYPAINDANLLTGMLPLPPLEEQKRIVAKIEELKPYVDKYNKAYSEVEKLNKKFPEDMQKSILQYAIQGKLVEQREVEGTAEELYQHIQEEMKKQIREGNIKKQKALPIISEEDIPFDIPESWKWVRLGEIGFTNIGLTYKPSDISNDGTIVLRSSNIQEGQLDYQDIVRVGCAIPDNKMCKKGDILICARNGSKRLVGKAALIDKEGMSFGAFMAIYRSLCNEYILHVINSAFFRNTMLPETGTTTINQITQETLRHCIVPLPPLEEQKRIVAKIEELIPNTKQLVNE